MFDFNPQLITAYIKTEDQQQLEINLQESNSDLQFYWQNEFTLVLRLSFSKRINISTTKIKIPFKFDTKDKVLLNGYQSWTETALYSIEDTPRAPFQVR